LKNYKYQMGAQFPTGNAPALMTRVRDLFIGLAGFTAAGASSWMVPGADGLLGAGLALLMLAIAVTDFRYLIIPNELTAAAFALAIINAAVGESTSIVEGVAAAALRGSITMLLFLAIRSIYAWLRHQEGIGLGDVKLAFVAGAWLDWVMIPVAIEIAALVALTAYVVRQIVSKQPINSTSRLPFGLFFAPAIWLSWLLSKMIFGPS
jgi:leader peptidase (prepilin peptidase)/N-methyltransferase